MAFKFIYGTTRKTFADGTGSVIHRNADGTETMHRWGPTREDNVDGIHWADGTTRLTSADGTRGTVLHRQANGDLSTHTWGPKPENNIDEQDKTVQAQYVSRRYSDGTGSEAIKSPDLTVINNFGPNPKENHPIVVTPR